VNYATLLFVLLAGWLAAAEAASQEPGDLRALAVNWVRGQYASPLVCDINGEPTRGLRRLLITPSPSASRIPLGRLIFVEMKTNDASRCFTDLGETAPNLRGTLQFRLPGAARPDTALRDLKALLKRNKGLEFHIVSGAVSSQIVGAEPATPKRTDYTGGRLRFDLAGEGSDTNRILADFASPRKLRMTLAPREGPEISLPLFLVKLR